MEADKVVEKLSCELARQLDKKKLRLACQNADRGDRIYGYTFVVNDVCKRVFKYYMGRVYYFDGRKWAECNDAVLKQSLRVALAEKSLDAVNCRTIQRDWSKIQTLVFNEAYNGAKLNELKLNKALVGFRNGVWDFTDVDNPVYHPFSDKMEVLSLLPYDYDPRALCPTWESFLCSVLTRGQRELLQARVKMTEEVFDRAKKKLLAYTQTPAYRERLEQDAGQIAALFGDNDCVLYVNEKDLGTAQQLRGLFGGNTEIMADKTIIIGGMKGFCKKMGIIADQTLDSKLQAQRTWFIENAELSVL